MDTKLLTVSQTAQYLQLSEKTIRRMIGMVVYLRQNLVTVLGGFVHVTLTNMCLILVKSPLYTINNLSQN